MKSLKISFVMVLSLVSACLAESGHLQKHMYKGTVPISNELFDSTVHCGLNLDEIEKCVAQDRSSGQGDSFCNDVKLYAGNKQKLIDANQSIKDNPATKTMQMFVIRTVSDIQKKYTHQFMDAGLAPEQIGKIPALKRGEEKNFKCKKIS
jgi:hypothetical protein